MQAAVTALAAGDDVADRRDVESLEVRVRYLWLVARRDGAPADRSSCHSSDTAPARGARHQDPEGILSVIRPRFALRTSPGSVMSDTDYADRHGAAVTRHRRADAAVRNNARLAANCGPAAQFHAPLALFFWIVEIVASPRPATPSLAARNETITKIRADDAQRRHRPRRRRVRRSRSALPVLPAPPP